jgi:hypothetical protein
MHGAAFAAGKYLHTVPDRRGKRPQLPAGIVHRRPPAPDQLRIPRHRLGPQRSRRPARRRQPRRPGRARSDLLSRPQRLARPDFTGLPLTELPLQMPLLAVGLMSPVACEVEGSSGPIRRQQGGHRAARSWLGFVCRPFRSTPKWACAFERPSRLSPAVPLRSSAMSAVLVGADGGGQRGDGRAGGLGGGGLEGKGGCHGGQAWTDCL